MCTSIIEIGVERGLRKTGELSFISVIVIVIETVLMPLLGEVSVLITLKACRKEKT